MLRARLATYTLLAGLGLSCGCSLMPGHSDGSSRSLFSHFRHSTPTEAACVETELPCSQGPGLQEYGPYPVAPTPQTAPCPNLNLQPAMPPLTAPPRMEPIPQAQPQPYTPSRF